MSTLLLFVVWAGLACGFGLQVPSPKSRVPGLGTDGVGSVSQVDPQNPIGRSSMPQRVACAPGPGTWDPAAVRSAYAPSEALLLDRHGEVIHELRVDRSRRRLAWTPLGEISPALVGAVLASEDRRFHAHDGVDARAVAAAAWAWATGGPRRGASTITMQLAALLDASLGRGRGTRTLVQKWAQMRAAWALEASWTKEEILEAYLNVVTFRGELQGVAAAAAVLFDKQPHGLSAAEGLVLAALLRAPNAGREALQRRVIELAQRLRVPGSRLQAPGLGLSIPDSNLAPATRNPQPGTRAPEPGAWNLEPGARDSYAAAIARVLERPRGTGPRVKLAPHVARRLLANPPAVVHSTLDASLQRFAAQTLRRHLLALRDRHVHDGALLVADNATGEVLAYVGSSGDLSPAPEVDGVQARRQAGSALKPFLYAAALDERLITPASLVEDAPLEIPVGGGLYRPQNYDQEFRGPVSVRAALAASLNIPAVRMLQLLGPETLARRLRRVGFALARPAEDYGPSLALGSADVTLWELVDAYRALANGGAWTPMRLVQGGAPAATEVHALSAAAAFLVADILADRESRTPTFGLENTLATRFWTAVKTGTSKDMRDNWCIGFSRRYTAGVWVGNFSGRPMHDVSGVSGAAPVWLEVMERLHRDLPSVAPPPPTGVSLRRVAFAQGSEPERDEWFITGTERAPSPAPLRAPLPRILSPARDTIIALDPDVPSARQRVLIEAQGGAALLLDGTALRSAAGVLWEPRPGAHALALADGSGREVDRVEFVVRGAASGQ